LVAQAFVGAQLLGIGLALFGGVVAARLARFARARSNRVSPAKGARELSRAVARTVCRYATARAADRYYVASKLRWDPITRVINELPVEFGSLLDMGCGRGQLGLLLLELGRVRELRGIDWDQDKIKTAHQAAGGAARFETGDLALADQPLAPFDTALLIDVLHYLPYAAQADLLRQIRMRLAPAGILLVREVDARATWRSRLTRWCEIIGTRLGVNRGRRMYFLASADLQQQLQQLGFTIAQTIAMPGLALDNVLVVARARSGVAAPSGRGTATTRH
jgi:2-polyprenyl-3-methyl-5-hydroxy-6-metoxy-1,4-benzoquinol methylase